MLDARFESIVGPCLPALYRTAYRLTGNRVDAEDLFQDVCLRAHIALRESKEIESPMAWLLRIQYHLFVDTTRRATRSPIVSVDPADAKLNASDQEPTLEDHADGQSEYRRLEEVWPLLRKEQRALLILVVEGYKPREIEVITGLESNVIRGRLHRARARLATLLVDEDGTKKVRTAI